MRQTRGQRRADDREDQEEENNDPPKQLKKEHEQQSARRKSKKKPSRPISLFSFPFSLSSFSFTSPRGWPAACPCIHPFYLFFTFFVVSSHLCFSSCFLFYQLSLLIHLSPRLAPPCERRSISCCIFGFKMFLSPLLLYICFLSFLPFFYFFPPLFSHHDERHFASNATSAVVLSPLLLYICFLPSFFPFLNLSFS